MFGLAEGGGVFIAARKSILSTQQQKYGCEGQVQVQRLLLSRHFLYSRREVIN
jgi:hypothetical protein